MYMVIAKTRWEGDLKRLASVMRYVGFLSIMSVIDLEC